MNRSSSWKYKHKGTGYLNRTRLYKFLFAFIVSSLSLLLLTRHLQTNYSFGNGIAFFALVVLSIYFLLGSVTNYFFRAKLLFLGTRYLICGESIVYFGNVTHIRMDEEAGRLHLMNNQIQLFVLDRNSFPTNARKAEKIKKNLDAKFSRVAEKIILRITHCAPAAEMTRIPGSATPDA
jgi:hypothetical protein